MLMDGGDYLQSGKPMFFCCPNIFVAHNITDLKFFRNWQPRLRYHKAVRWAYQSNINSSANPRSYEAPSCEVSTVYDGSSVDISVRLPFRRYVRIWPLDFWNSTVALRAFYTLRFYEVFVSSSKGLQLVSLGVLFYIRLTTIAPVDEV